MNRKDLIQAKLDEKTKVDFEEVTQDDKRAINKMIADEEDNLYTVNKQIKKYKENHTLTLGSDFVALVERKKAVEGRITLIKEIQENHV